MSTAILLTAALVGAMAATANSKNISFYNEKLQSPNERKVIPDGVFMDQSRQTYYQTIKEAGIKNPFLELNSDDMKRFEDVGMYGQRRTELMLPGDLDLIQVYRYDGGFNI